MAECFEHSYWNLLNEVVHTEIVLLTKKEMVYPMEITSQGIFTVGYISVFILEWIENNMVVRYKARLVA